MSAVNYGIGDNPAYHGETSSGFMELVQNNVTSVTDAISALSKRVSDQQTALSDHETALNAGAGQLQTLYQSLIDNNGIDSIDFDIEGRAIVDQHANDLRDQAIANLQAQMDDYQAQMDDYRATLEVVSSLTSALSEVMQYQHDVL